MYVIKKIINKYKIIPLRKQIQVLMIVFMFIPIVLSITALFGYYSKVLIDKTTVFALESIRDKAESLSNYLKSYMEPYYLTTIEEDIWERMETNSYEETVSDSSRMFSMLEEAFPSTINDTALVFCMKKDESGFLYVRRPMTQKIVTDKNMERYQDLIDLAKASSGKEFLVTRLYEYNGKNCIAISHRIYNYKSKEEFGNIVMVLYQEKIWSILDKPQDSYISYVLQTEDETLISDKEEVLQEQINISEKSENVNWTDWKLLYSIDTKRIAQDIGGTAVIISFLIFLIFIITVHYVNYLIRKKMGKLDMLEHSMNQIRKEGKYELLPQNNMGELNSLFGGYNKMVNEIIRQREYIYQQNEQALRSLKKQQEAEIKALELEINSHFIYNTLNAINYVAVIHSDYETSDLIKVFANVLRYMTERRYQLVTLKQETEWLEQYLFLQKSRFSDSFDYEVRVQPQMEKVKIRKLVLQPFVENAVVHGLMDIKYKGKIKIKCQEGKDGNLEITISDNGKGMSEETLESLRKINSIETEEENLGLGISNTCYRMKLYYGEAFRISVDSHIGEGTEVRLILPLL